MGGLLLVWRRGTGMNWLNFTVADSKAEAGINLDQVHSWHNGVTDEGLPYTIIAFAVMATTLASGGMVALGADPRVAYFEEMILPWNKDRAALVAYAAEPKLFERVGRCLNGSPLFDRLKGRAVTQAMRELSGNTSLAFPAPDVWSLQHPVLYTLLWVVIILVIFVPLSVRQYRLSTSR